MRYIKLIVLSLVISGLTMSQLTGEFFGLDDTITAKADYASTRIDQPFQIDKTGLPSPVLVRNGPMITLLPTSGPEGISVIISGQGWPVGEQVMIFLVATGHEYKLANTTSNEAGRFSVTSSIPAGWSDKNVYTVWAHSLNSNATAQTPFVYVDTSTPTQNLTSLQTPSTGIVTAGQLNVRSGPGVTYPVIGRVSFNQSVNIVAQSNGWWHISYPHAAGDFGWVSGVYINTHNTSNMSFNQSTTSPSQTARPAPTLPPLPSPVCNPGQWSGCNPSFCPNEHVSQCDNNGQWGECIWDPGSCGEQEDDDDDDDDDDN